MKTKYTLIILAALPGLVCSCDLTRLPEDKLTLESYFKNESQCAMWFNSCYNDYLADFTALRVNADDVLEKDMGDEIFMGMRTVNSNYDWDWDNLRKINEFFQYSGNCEEPATLVKYTGIASFFRAYEYFNKVRAYGDVPYYTTPIGSSDKDNLKKKRDSRVVVMKNVLKDLDVAIENLSSDVSKSQITKWSALALKCRAALYEGTFEKYHPDYGEHASEYDPSFFLNEAVSAAEALISGKKYSIYKDGATPYFDLFSSLDAITQEVILSRVYDYSTLSLGHKAKRYIYENRMGFTRRFISHYLNSDGSRHTTSATSTYQEDVTGRDPRFAQTVLCPGFVKPGTLEKKSNDLTSITGYQPVKFLSVSINDADDKCENDYPCFRYAEVLLNYAEAKAELMTLTQEDLNNSVNLIRKRVGMPDLIMATANSDIDPFLLSCYPNVSSNSNKGVILEIRRERTIELVMEGFRQDDLVRWREGAQMSPSIAPWNGLYLPGPGLYDMDNDGVKELEAYVTTPTHSAGDGSGVIFWFQMTANNVTGTTSGYIIPTNTTAYVWNEKKDYLWPVPSKQITLNPNLVQNPGW